MSQNTEQLSLSFEQILAIVQQLSVEEKLILSKELEKATLNYKLSELLECFKTDELSWVTINEEVEAVRTEIYAIKTKA